MQRNLVFTVNWDHQDFVVDAGPERSSPLGNEEQAKKAGFGLQSQSPCCPGTTSVCLLFEGLHYLLPAKKFFRLVRF